MLSSTGSRRERRSEPRARIRSGCSCVVAVRSAPLIAPRDGDLPRRDRFRAAPRRELATGLPKRTRQHRTDHGAGLAGPPHLTLRPDVLHSSGESPRLRLGDRREATWHALRPTHAKLCGAVGCAAAVQQGARRSRGSGAVSHRGAGGQVRSVGHARAQHLLLLVRRHRLACSPPPGAASTGSVPSHAWSHVRRAGTRSRG